MPAYKYSLSNTANGTTSVEFNINPDFTAGVMAGGSVTVTGRVKNSSYAIRTVEAKIDTTSAANSTGYGYFYGVVSTASAAANTWVPFSITMRKHASGTTLPSGTQAVANCYLHVNVQIANSTSSMVYITPSTSNKFTIFNWHTSAHIADGSGIVRCDGNGIQRPDGNRLRFENFQVLTHSGSSLTRIRFEVIQSGASSGTTKDATTSTTPTISRLTSSPYTESAPSFFPTTIALNSAYSYTILISFTDAYETTQQSLGIPRGAPILDFSLAAKGGLAVGQYSSSTDTEPRFEVAYPTYLAGGLVLTPGETRDTRSGQLMMTGIRFGRKEAPGSIAAGGGNNTTINFSPAFSTTNYVILATVQRGNGCVIRTGNQTTSSFNVRIDNKGSQAYRPVIHWLAIEGSTEDSGDISDSGGGTTPSYPENLILNSDVKYESSAYMIHEYTLSEPFQLNQTYTITAWGELGEGKTGLYPHIGNSQNYTQLASRISEGVYSGTISRSSWVQEPTTATKLLVYVAPNNVTGVTSRIDRIKLEKGSNSNPTWTPNPQD